MEWGKGGKLHHEKDHYLVKLIPGCRQVLIFWWFFWGFLSRDGGERTIRRDNLKPTAVMCAHTYRATGANWNKRECLNVLAGGNKCLDVLLLASTAIIITRPRAASPRETAKSNDDDDDQLFLVNKEKTKSIESRGARRCCCFTTTTASTQQTHQAPT